jgi:hypothetical protein
MNQVYNMILSVKSYLKTGQRNTVGESNVLADKS